MRTYFRKMVPFLGAAGLSGCRWWLLCGSFLLFPVNILAQVAAYGLEEAAASGGVEDAGYGSYAVDMAPALLPDASSQIGSTRSGIRSQGGQSAMLRYDQHREITPPAYATLRIGPFYSNVSISQSVGYRYTRFSGTGVDYLQGNLRGEVLKDGSEFPLVSGITFNNYLIITRKMDLEANISIQYHHYPMGTQEDDLQIRLTDEGVFATFSSQFFPSRNSRILVYDDILYRTDYVDTRGLADRYGGEQYEYLQNTIGLDWDWKPTPLDTWSASVSRRDTIPFDKAFDNQKGWRTAQMASYRRSLTPFAAVGMMGNASQNIYTEESRSDVFLYGLRMFCGVRLAERWQSDLSLGYQVSEQRGGDEVLEQRTSGSISASAGLTHEITDFHTQRVFWQRSLADSFSGGVDLSDTAGYSLDWSAGLFPGSLISQYSRFAPRDALRTGYADWTTMLSVQHQLTRFVKLSMNASYAMRMNDAAGTEENPVAPDLASDYETLTLSISTGFNVTKKTVLSVYASHADRTSDNSDLVYTRDTVGCALTWSHRF